MSSSADSAKTSLDAVIGRLSVLHRKRIDLGLLRKLRLLEWLCRPELMLPPVMHFDVTIV